MTERKQSNSPSNDLIGEAIFSVNRHAKTASDPKFLYRLKKEALQKMIREGTAKKVGLQFSNHPRLSFQQSDVLIKCGQYLFHMPPSKEDFQNLPHLGHLSDQVRNPSSRLSLSQAKKLLIDYTGLKEAVETPKVSKYTQPIFTRLGESYPTTKRKK